MGFEPEVARSKAVATWAKVRFGEDRDQVWNVGRGSSFHVTLKFALQLRKIKGKTQFG
jgi:hypothetical protein